MPIECLMCGACCTAYSISSLDKPAGKACVHLMDDKKCDDYDNRPQVCRDFKADKLCILLSTLGDEERLKVIKQIYGLDE